MTRRISAWVLILMFVTSVVAETPELKGIQTGDLNRSVDPCTDFYEFTSGTWRANNPIPASQSVWSRRFKTNDSTKDKLHQILEQSAKTSATKGSNDQLIGDFYTACMDESRINVKGIEPLKSWIDRISAIQDRTGIQETILSFHNAQINAPFIVIGYSDNHDPSMVIAQIIPGGLGLPERDYYLRPEPRFAEAREKYKEHIGKMMLLAGYGEARANTTADTVFRMETKFAEKSLDNVSRRDPVATDHKMNYDELQKLMPSFHWKEYFDAAGISMSKSPNVFEPEFMKEVERQINETPIDDWKEYFTWHLINAEAPYLSSSFVEEDWSFKGKYLGGATEMKPRWKRCVETTDRVLGEALGKKYTDRYFPPAAKKRMQELVKNLLAAMEDDIKSLTWMGPETKKKALEKISTFNPKIGYPDKWKDYSKVVITQDDYFGNVLAGLKFNVEDDRATISKPVDRGRWGMTPPTSNAYYEPQLNEIVFPAGILQPPAFSMEATDAVNYGAIGVVIGHEISHGFDDQGAQYDAEGRLFNWWTAGDLKRFQERGACVADQFDHYYIEEGVHHNGKLVLGESIGDLGGLKIAYLAWKKSLKGKPAPRSIDGFTPEQQFFISFGQFRGDDIRIERQRVMMQSDPHPIGKYRLIGSISNTLEFQQAFSCKPDAAMVRPPENRCEVW